jgi:putative ABC transport system permease protein
MILLSIISIRERKYEIGVLRAMGMKKKKVMWGLWAEIIVVTCICFILGMGAGAALSQPVSDTLLAGQVQSATSSTNPYATNIQPLDKVDVSVNGITALEIFGISILLASIAGVVSISKITKYEPIKILMERN